MPSDPSGVNPKGVLTRSAPDFFDDNLATGGFYTQPVDVAGHDYYVSISLYNDATTGVALKVYGLTAQNDVGFGDQAYFIKGTLGVLVAQCINVRADLGAPFGQIWQKTDLVVANAANPNPIPAQTIQLANPGFNGETWFSTFPIAIIPAGYSLVVVNTHDCSTFSVGFWYQMANE